MNTPPPCTGGQIGYGETNITFNGSGFVRELEKASRKCPPRGLLNASVSVTLARFLARIRDAIAAGSCSAARATPAKLARSGESPNNQLNIAFAHVNQKCDVKRCQS